jgi:single-stranded-DNA-specific exonuclease
MCQKWGVPALISAPNELGMMVGSARAPGGFSLVALLRKCEDFLVQYGGHDLAAGFQYSKEKEDDFLLMLKKNFSTFVPDDNSQKQDFLELEGTNASIELPSEDRFRKLEFKSAELLDKDIDFQLVEWVELFEPFGKSFENFLFQLKNFLILDVASIKGRHLKIQIKSSSEVPLLNGSSRVWTAWIFSPDQEIVRLLEVCETFDLICEIQRNEFRGRESLQFIVRDLRGVSK